MQQQSFLNLSIACDFALYDTLIKKFNVKNIDLRVSYLNNKTQMVKAENNIKKRKTEYRCASSIYTRPIAICHLY